MKYFIASLIYFVFGYIHVFAQLIPYGTSSDSLVIITPPNTIIYEGSYHIYYYKPPNYDSINSPILWYVHGTGGTGAEGVTVLSNMAQRRNALIVAPSMHNGIYGWAYVSDMLTDTSTDCFYLMWSSEIFKQIYRHVLQRENRDSTSVYLTGFSQGGQFTSRYMLIRQFAPDSIPINMAVSISGANYTLCTDTFNNIEMLWRPFRCGLAGVQTMIWDPYNQPPHCELDTPRINTFICSGHVQQYYNENYGVLVGTLDTTTFTGFCPNQGGKDRYERAVAFYNFSDTNAISRGTSLKWKIDSIPGVAHNGYALYNTPAAGDSIPIAERMLFETPWHSVPSFAPIASFNFSDSALMISFSDASQNTNNWLWDFGDGVSSLLQNPVHTYTVSGIYNVCLTAGDACASDTYCDSVTVFDVGVNEVKRNEKFIISPNPTTGKITISSNSNIISMEIYNVLGQQIYKSVNPPMTVDLSPFSNGIYLIITATSKHIFYHNKIIKSIQK